MRSEAGNNTADERSAYDEPAGLAEARFAYPPIERLGVIGDRRTAALVAADGTLCWLPWPDFDSPPVFGSLLDHQIGGFWRVGPAKTSLGRQCYEENTTTLVTVWDDDESQLELTDFMPFAHTDRPQQLKDSRMVARRIRAVRGDGSCKLELCARRDFGDKPRASLTSRGATLEFGDVALSVWSSIPLQLEGQSLCAAFSLKEGEEAWFLLSTGGGMRAAIAAGAEHLLSETEAYWRDWVKDLTYTGFRSDWVTRSAITFHLLSYAPSGALVAAASSSLPERVGGERNYDYRFAWIRDVSLTLAILATLGDLRTSQRYMDWLSGLDSENDMPLQVLYRIDGGTCAEQSQRDELDGYRGSRPVRIGNHAVSQYQIDSLGYLADCALIYLEKGGEWKDEYWEMIRSLADHAADNWQRPTNGIWELDPPQHYVTDKVMAWVTLERSIKMAHRLDMDVDLWSWDDAKQAIFEEVMDKGWSEELGAFRQRYEAETLDASILLMAMMEFLPADHPRMRSTINAIAEQLSVGGLVYRFNPPEQAEPIELPLGEAEGAFLPCTFWLAAAYAMLGEDRKAQDILEQVEAVAGDLQLFAEEIDPAARAFLGNTPLLFSHAVYIKAVMEIVMARPLRAAEMVAGRAVSKLKNKVLSEGRSAER